jgi:hypothetical protein
MNCEHLQNRMQHRLDDRLALDDDLEMIEHANGCESCLAHLQAWRSIEMVIDATSAARPEHQSQTLGPVFYRIAAIAASALIAFSLITWNRSETAGQFASTNQATDSAESESIDVASTLDALKWWQTVSQGEWLAQTMPTVRSVQEGVAPLGRSLMQLVTILTVGPSDSISEADPIGSPGNVGESSQTS